jgi:O-antigen ligase
MASDFDIDKLNQYLLIILAFLLPLTVFGANLIIVIICLIWLLSGNYKSKLQNIIKSKLLVASIIFYLIHIIGLIWTDDIKWGLHILHKMWYFILLFPILFSITKKEFVKFYIFSFILAMSLTEILSFLVLFEAIPPFKNAQVYNPTPFMSHVSYNPILSFTIYITLHEVFLNKELSKLQIILYTLLSISMTITMFVTLGRAGQVGFFVILSVLIFQFFRKQIFKSLLLTFISIPILFFTFYELSDSFHLRVDRGIAEFSEHREQNQTSVGLRLNYAINSAQIIKNHPITGVGTGDYPSAYMKINKVNSPGLPETTNPHNMYILVWSQIGIVGLISMLSIFYYQIKFSLNSKDQFSRNAGIALPLLFLVLMLSDSYLMGHYTSLLFIFFSSFLYKNFEKY